MKLPRRKLLVVDVEGFEQALAKSVPAGQSAIVDALDAACQQALTLLANAKGAAVKTRSRDAQKACFTFVFGFVDALAQ